MPLSEARIFRTRGDKDDRPLVRNLLKKLGEYMDAEALSRVEEAFEFGAGAHKGQKRQTGEAYISHPVAVAEILGGMRMDSRTIIAAILHDVVEDTNVTLEELAARFGTDVAHLVDRKSVV